MVVELGLGGEDQSLGSSSQSGTSGRFTEKKKKYEKRGKKGKGGKGKRGWTENTDWTTACIHSEPKDREQRETGFGGLG